MAARAAAGAAGRGNATPKREEPKAAAAAAAAAAPAAAAPIGTPQRQAAATAEAGKDERGKDKDAEGAERRKRAALKQFYQAPAPSATSDPLDIDGSSFNSDSYLQKLYRQYDLSTLMKKEDEFATQIRGLDGEMQSLVYDNYNKFISATDTIRKMKTQVETMETDMKRLEDNMLSIGELSAQIDLALAPKREQIYKLSCGHALLKKLQFLFELPSRLRLCVEKKSYEQAVEYYTKASGILNQYKNMDSFKSIYDECSEIMQKLKAHLTTQLDSKGLSQREMVTMFDLLKKLSDSPAQMYDMLLGRAQQQWNADREEQTRRFSHEARGSTGLQEYIEFGATKVLFNLGELIASYKTTFVGDLEAEGLKATQSQMRQFEERRVAQQQLVTKVDVLIQEYLDAAVVRVAASNADPEMKMSTIVGVLDALLASLNTINDMLPQLGVAHRCVEICNKIVRQQSILARDRLVATVRTRLDNAHTQLRSTPTRPAPNLSDTAQKLASAVMEDVKTTLGALQSASQANFARNNSFFNQEFPARVVRVDVVQQWLTQFTKHTQSFADDDASAPVPKRDGPPPSTLFAPPAATSEPADPPSILFLLVLSRVSLDFSKKYVRQIVETTASMFRSKASVRKGRREPTPMGERAELTDVDELVIAEHSKNIKECGEEVVSKFVNLQGRQVAHFLRDNLLGTNWLTRSEATEVLPYMKEVIAKLQEAESLVAQLYDDGDVVVLISYCAVVEPRRKQAQAARILSANLMANIQRIFAEKIDVFGVVDFNRYSIMLGIAKIIAKTYSESVRHTTLSKFGLQQIEINCNCLNKFFARYVIDERSENVINVLMTQVISSAVQRCLDPVQLDKHDIIISDADADNR